MWAVFLYLGSYRAERQNDDLKLFNAIRFEDLCEEELKSILEQDFHIAMTKEVTGEMEEVCN